MIFYKHFIYNLIIVGSSEHVLQSQGAWVGIWTLPLTTWVTLTKEQNVPVPLKNGSISRTYVAWLLLESSEMVRVKAIGTHRQSTRTLTIIIWSKGSKLMYFLNQGI